MELPASWVDALFAKLSIRYGAVFARQYADLDIAAVKADWAKVLGMFSFRPEAIAYALEYLPADKAPNASQFRTLCMAAPMSVRARLPRPAQNPEKAREVVEAVKAALAPHGDPLAGARRLRQRESEGDKSLTPFQREFWRAALRHEGMAA